MLTLLLGAPAGAGQGSAPLDSLFQALRAAPDDVAAEPVEGRIWDVWLQHPDETLLAEMRSGVLSLNADDYPAALDAFDRVVARDPTYAEGWNKRASAHYMLGDYESAMNDLRRALLLEPRHFGALATLGLVYLELDRPAAALRAFDAALAINPHLPNLRRQAQSIRISAAGLAL
ncbi:tetratricopeptide repeat protein [Azospirillum thermophilum]|uniref:tetratricopeptide repeat protein n=1 Tax=Azospirillum thermophilum TaxID=2202148 RepID=UPI001FE74EE7|nr:tetratricopeptide repeat protein [Azospirillum thermophilum]